jgi:CubicO group peptidase (beta-lactamase class C family)
MKKRSSDLFYLSFVCIFFINNIVYSQTRTVQPTQTRPAQPTQTRPAQPTETRTVQSPQIGEMVQSLVTSGAWIARHGLTPAQYQAEFNKNSQAGYRLTNVNGYTQNGQERYAAIWEKTQGPEMATHHGMTADQYQQRFNEYSRQGFRLTHISGYGVGNQARFAAIWEKKSGGEWAARHNLTASQYQTEFNNHQRQGFRLVHVCGYVVNNVEYFAAIWEKRSGGEWQARHNLTGAQFQSAFDDLGRQGYTLTNVSGYNKNNTNFYTGIWEKITGAPRFVRHGVTADNYQHAFDNMYYQGYRPLHVQGFASGNSSRFNGIWINNNFSGADLAKIDNAVNSYMNSQNVTGLSLAITQNGRLVYAKGYGNARTGVEMSPNHSLRVWSISKPITSVGIMRLVQQGNPNLLDRRVFGPNSILGATFATPANNTGLNDITVRQMLNMTSGLRTCNGEPVFWNTTSTAATVMSTLMSASDIITVAPDRRYIYSNTNYYFLARVIEAVSGQTYENYIRNNVLNQCGIGNTMYVGRADGESRVGEATYTPHSKPNMQHFGGFGGWVARPIDLVNFLRYVDGAPNPADIINAGNHATMTTTSTQNTGYALGWNVGGTLQNHNGCFNGGRSFLVELENGLSYAVIVNSNPNNDDCGWTLKSVLDAALPTVSKFPSYDLF